MGYQRAVGLAYAHGHLQQQTRVNKPTERCLIFQEAVQNTNDRISQHLMANPKGETEKDKDLCVAVITLVSVTLFSLHGAQLYSMEPCLSLRNASVRSRHRIKLTERVVCMCVCLFVCVCQRRKEEGRWGGKPGVHTPPSDE